MASTHRPIVTCAPRKPSVAGSIGMGIVASSHGTYASSESSRTVGRRGATAVVTVDNAAHISAGTLAAIVSPMPCRPRANVGRPSWAVIVEITVRTNTSGSAPIEHLPSSRELACGDSNDHSSRPGSLPCRMRIVRSGGSSLTGTPSEPAVAGNGDGWAAPSSAMLPTTRTQRVPSPIVWLSTEYSTLIACG